MEIQECSFDLDTVEKRTWGAGILPYTVDTDGTIRVLLARERFVASWKGSCRWSGFEGARKDNETVVQTACREFLEESLGVVLAEEDVRLILEKKTYAFRIVLKVSNDRNTERYHCTYAVPIRWCEDLPARFQTRRQKIEHIDRLKQEYDISFPEALKKFAHVGNVERVDDEHVSIWCETMDEDGQHVALERFDRKDAHDIVNWVEVRRKLERALFEHPCVIVTRETTFGFVKTVDINLDHIEKDQLRWWRLTDLESVLRRRGVFETERFRPYFMPVLQTLVAQLLCHEASGVMSRAPECARRESTTSEKEDTVEQESPPVAREPALE